MIYFQYESIGRFNNLEAMMGLSSCICASPRLLNCTNFSSYGSRFTSQPFKLNSTRATSYGRTKLCGARAWAPLSCRASLRDLTTGQRIEIDKLDSSIRDRTMKAVDELGARVTIGDVASRAGLKLNEAEKALQALAADSGGFLEVSDEGDVLYVFPSDYRAKLAAKSFRLKFEPVLDKLKAVAEYLIRVSFGTALLASIVLIYTTIFALVSTRSEEDNRGSRGGRSYNPGFTVFISPSDLFWYWDPYYYRKPRGRRAEGGMNFFESVFSFVFGDGDPNQGSEEERWKLIGKYIASNGGVVTAEELAPYLDVPLISENKGDESFVLPVLLRFDGQPEVDSKGNILYRFPSFQRTASNWLNKRKEYVGKQWKTWIRGATNFFEEKKWNFSKAGPKERLLVVALGGANLAGVIILGSMLKDIATIRGGFLSFIVDIFPLLQVYALSFFVIPLSRWFIIQKRNAEIDKRNRARKQRALALEVPDSSLRHKLESARDMAEQTVIGADRIIYSTERDFVEQDYDVKEWEQQFTELE